MGCIVPAYDACARWRLHKRDDRMAAPCSAGCGHLSQHTQVKTSETKKGQEIQDNEVQRHACLKACRHPVPLLRHVCIAPSTHMELPGRRPRKVPRQVPHRPWPPRPLPAAAEASQLIFRQPQRARGAARHTKSHRWSGRCSGRGCAFPGAGIGGYQRQAVGAAKEGRVGGGARCKEQGRAWKVARVARQRHSSCLHVRSE